MSRPEFPTGIVLPTNCISSIRESQEAYDRNPEEYERREQQDREEQQRMEEDHIAEYRQQQQEETQNWQDELLITEPETTIEDLPF